MVTPSSFRRRLGAKLSSRRSSPSCQVGSPKSSSPVAAMASATSWSRSNPSRPCGHRATGRRAAASAPVEEAGGGVDEERLVLGAGEAGVVDELEVGVGAVEDPEPSSMSSSPSGWPNMRVMLSAICAWRPCSSSRRQASTSGSALAASTSACHTPAARAWMAAVIAAARAMRSSRGPSPRARYSGRSAERDGLGVAHDGGVDGRAQEALLGAEALVDRLDRHAGLARRCRPAWCPPSRWRGSARWRRGPPRPASARPAASGGTSCRCAWSTRSAWG